MMLEEAAGIAGLHVRRRDAEQKLRATETNLARLDDILGDMDNRASSLRRQARAAERYSRLTDQIRTVEARLIYARWRDAASAAEIARRSEEHTSELQSLMRISYAVFCLKKTNTQPTLPHMYYITEHITYNNTIN